MNNHFNEDDFLKPLIKTISGEPVPISTIFCVGRNYREHLKELHSQDLGEPLIFIKPTTALFQGPQTLPLPKNSSEIHHEIELAILIGKTGKDISREDAPAYIAGAAVALDLTMRDLQNQAKKNGTPWTIAKGFDYSCPISPIYPETHLETLANIQLFLDKNGCIVQHGHTQDMIFPIDYLITYISRFFTLRPGDLILTGTPEGVGPIFPGDTLSFKASFSEPITLQFY